MRAVEFIPQTDDFDICAVLQMDPVLAWKAIFHAITLGPFEENQGRGFLKCFRHYFLAYTA